MQGQGLGRPELGATIGQVQRQALGQTQRLALRLIALSGPDLTETLTDLVAGNPFLVLRRPRLAGASEDAVEALVASGPTLMEHVLGQVPRLVPAPADRPLALALVEALDARGYLAEPLDAIAARCGTTRARAEAVLARMQAIAPEGLFARDLAECLRLQLAAEGALSPEFAALLDNLPLLERGKLGLLATACGVDEARLQTMLRRLRALDPAPGAAFAAPPVRPGALAELVFAPAGSGAWQVSLNADGLPGLRLDSGLRQPGQGAAMAAAWAEARRLHTALTLRNRALLAVGEVIARHQGAALDGPDSALLALTRREIAAACRLHETTVGRLLRHTAARIEGPRGPRLVPLARYVGRECAVDARGHPVSRRAVMGLIRDHLDLCGDPAPLTDADLTSWLAERGIHLARRTVSRYRAAAHIAPARVRAPRA